MTKRKTNKKAGASSTVSKRTEVPPLTPTEPFSPTTISDSTINRHKSTLPNDAPQEPITADSSTTPFKPCSQQRTTSIATNPQTAPVNKTRISTLSATNMTFNADKASSPSANTQPNNNNTPPASVNNSNTTAFILPPSSRVQTSDHISSLKLSTKDMEAETLHLQQILAVERVELQERKKELMGRVRGNEFGRRWREVRRKRVRGGSRRLGG
jgi:hypothetical protein